MCINVDKNSNHGTNRIVVRGSLVYFCTIMVINHVAIQIQEINTKSNKRLLEVIGLVTSCRYVQNVLLVEYRDT